MKKKLILLLLLSQIFPKAIENDVAYKRVLKELDGAVPVSFIEEAFSHEKLEIHKIIAERFAKPYEKKPWVEYKKIFVKESRVAAGAKFYNENKKLIGDELIARNEHFRMVESIIACNILNSFRLLGSPQITLIG